MRNRIMNMRMRRPSRDYGRNGTIDYQGSMQYGDGNDYGRGRRDNGYPNDYGRNDYGRNDYGRNDYGRNDYGRNDYGYDYGEPTERLNDQDMMEWEQNLRNKDGTVGKHYTLEQIRPVAQKLGVQFDGYTDKEFCMALNMLYSDNCAYVKHYVTPDKELMYYVEATKAWLEDDDGKRGWEKLASYYDNIVTK